MNDYPPDHSATIRAGRAYVRLIDAATGLSEWTDDDRSRAKWQRVRRSAQASPRKVVEVLPAHVAAEIMAASEKALGTVRDVRLNQACCALAAPAYNPPSSHPTQNQWQPTNPIWGPVIWNGYSHEPLLAARRMGVYGSITKYYNYTVQF